MSIQYGCGLCCMMLSIWACIQLFIMGIFFKMEVLTFIEEAEPEHHAYENYDEFILLTRMNYSSIALNCWLATVIYLIFIGISYYCMRKAKAKELILEAVVGDDEKFCLEQSNANE